MTFIKWPSAENHYQSKHLDYFTGMFPALLDETFVITEKIHGASFQWELSPNQPLRCGSRNQYLDITQFFQGTSIPELRAAHKELLAFLQDYCDHEDVAIRLFGELFGQGINKGVNYGAEKRLLYFGLMFDDILVPYSTLIEFVSSQYLVPLLAEVKGLTTALAFDSVLDSALSDRKNNTIEGIVITPRNRVYRTAVGETFMIKKKNDAFLEKKTASGVVDDTDPEIVRLNNVFRLYLNDNRVQSVFSKKEPIATLGELGEYIKLVLADAQADFLKDVDVSHLNKAQLKLVFNVGGTVANMLKSYL